jgi:hypothetical protein
MRYWPHVASNLTNCDIGREARLSGPADDGGKEEGKGT